MTDPARFNRRLVLETPTETPDGAGGVARTFQTFATIWAKITPVSARGDAVADSQGATITHRIVIRAPREVTTACRFTEDGAIYRIVTVRESTDRRLIEIAAEQRIG